MGEKGGHSAVSKLLQFVITKFLVLQNLKSRLYIVMLNTARFKSSVKSWKFNQILKISCSELSSYGFYPVR